ncbi:MAG: hypothetical protein Q4C03_01005 [bacterium]|nr:hypothetical protein [bacterium]
MPSMEDKFNYMQDLDQRIAEARAKVALENSLPEKKMMAPAILDYIVEGDSGLYKSIYDANRQRELQAAQFKQQKELQAAQLENAIRLAQEARQAQESRNASDLELKRKQANIRLRAAQTALANAQAEGSKVAIDNAQKELELSMAEAESLNEQAGIAPVKIVENIPSVSQEATPEVPAEPKGPVAKGVRIADLKAINGFKTEKEKNKILSNIKSDPLYNQDPNIRSEFNRLYGIRSDEARENRRLELEKKGSAATPAELAAEGLEWQIKTDKNGKKTRRLGYKKKTK